jgi:hypothetical protein
MKPSRDSSVGIATGCGLDDPSSISGRSRIFLSLLHSVQTSSGVHPASYPLHTYLRLFLRVLIESAWRGPLISIGFRVQECCSYTATSPYVFMTWCLVKFIDTFIFYKLWNVHINIFLQQILNTPVTQSKSCVKSAYLYIWLCTDPPKTLTDQPHGAEA